MRRKVEFGDGEVDVDGVGGYLKSLWKFPMTCPQLFVVLAAYVVGNGKVGDAGALYAGENNVVHVGVPNIKVRLGRPVERVGRTRRTFLLSVNPPYHLRETTHVAHRPQRRHHWLGVPSTLANSLG